MVVYLFCDYERIIFGVGLLFIEGYVNYYWG